MKLFTRNEGAEYLRLSLRKLDALCAEGELRRVKIGTGQRARVLFREEDLEQFILANLSDDRRDSEHRVREIMGSRN